MPDQVSRKGFYVFLGGIVLWGGIKIWETVSANDFAQRQRQKPVAELPFRFGIGPNGLAADVQVVKF